MHRHDRIFRFSQTTGISAGSIRSPEALARTLRWALPIARQLECDPPTVQRAETQLIQLEADSRANQAAVRATSFEPPASSHRP